MPDYRYQCLDCGKTYIGAQLPGGMTCNCMPPKKIIGKMIIAVAAPLSPALSKEVGIDVATSMRNSMCIRWGIPNKSHVTHGANFSGNQKVVNLINNIVEPVTGGLRTRVREAIIREYQYDIDSGSMV